MTGGGHLRQRSPGSFELRWRANGKTRTETFKGNKKAAGARLRELLVAVDRGVDVAPSKITIAQLVRERIALWRSEGRITARTEESYSTMAKLIDASLGHVALPRLTTRQIEQWHQTLRARGLSAATIRKANALLGHALADAQRHNLVARNVAREQGAPRAPAGRIQVLTVDRIRPLLEALCGTEFHAPATLTIYGGLRRGEALGLKWSDLSLEQATMTISRAIEEVGTRISIKPPKTRAGIRKVSLPAVAVQALQDHRRHTLETRMALGMGKLADDALVFPDPLTGAPQSPRAFTKRWSRVSRRVASGVRWHSLRHLHASLLVHHGVDLATVAARLGHAQIDTTLRTYTHQVTPDDRHAADALDRALGQ
jgi:integrase